MSYGLIGEKLSHSFSKTIHNQLGNYKYELISVPKKEFKRFMERKAFNGLNVTIPYKKDVIPYCDHLSEAARRIGSVNTLVKDDEGNLLGYNTDYDGFCYMARGLGLSFEGKKTLILGSGGTSLTARTAMEDMGAAPVIVISRKGPVTYDDLVDHCDAKIIVNTTPVGMYPNNGQKIVDLGAFPHCEGVLDVIYNPLKTALTLDAESLGIPYKNGLSMLVAQAKYASEMFTGNDIPDSVIDEIHQELKGSLQNIVLIGMPGCGKTAVGQKVAELLDRKFVDTDDLIIEETGKSIPEIFEEVGEEGFRKLETEVVKRVGKETGLVIATGGGAVMRKDNRKALKQNGVIFWLQRELEELSQDGRPLSKDLAALKRIYNTRKSIYGSLSDQQIENNGPVESIAEAITSHL